VGVWAYGRMGVWAYGRIGVSACRRKESEVTSDLDLGSTGIRQSRSSIRRLALRPLRRHAHTPIQRSRFARISSPISFVETSFVPSDQISLVRTPLAIVWRTADSIRAAVSGNSNE
jgi:hypothetical protein